MPLMIRCVDTRLHHCNIFGTVDTGFNTVQEKFQQLKSEESSNSLLINKLLNEISELKKDIAKVS